jgi:hypothetical protein
MPEAVRPLTARQLPEADRARPLEALDDGATVSATMILDAIGRLENATQTRTIVRLTWLIAVMTAIVAVTGVVLVVRP